MNVRFMENRRWAESRNSAVEPGTEMLDLLARSDTPAVATDGGGHVIFWNGAAERLFGRSSSQALGRRCYDVIGGRDVFGNRYCHENCSVVSMSRRGETVHAFELILGSRPRPEQSVNVTVLKVPGSRPDLFTLVHVFQPIDAAGRLVRALERLGATPSGNGHDSLEPVQTPRPSGSQQAPSLTERENEILRWVAAGLQNKEIAQRLGISLATVRNHIHNILEKLEVHSKLEAISLAFRQGWVTAPDSVSARETARG
jgi:DNA-binding CsgD family transcriptional regulator